jgi:hypothetical protein
MSGIIYGFDYLKFSCQRSFCSFTIEQLNWRKVFDNYPGLWVDEITCEDSLKVD